MDRGFPEMIRVKIKNIIDQLFAEDPFAEQGWQDRIKITGVDDIKGVRMADQPPD